MTLSLVSWTVYLSTHALVSTRLMVGYVAGAVLIGAAGWLDDIHSLPIRSRLVVQSAAAFLSILVLGYWQNVGVPILGSLHLGWLGAIVTFFWIVGLTNAYNFMDGVDGIAGTQAVIAGFGWAILGAELQQPALAVLGVLLLSTSIGFLGHNWPPARIFMGDVGSAFLGYTFAVLPVLGATIDMRLPFAGFLMVWPFVFDAAFTFMRRLLKGENVSVAHRSHLYQRLVIAGRSHRFVSVLYGGLALIGVILAQAWLHDVAGELVLPVLPLLCIGLWTFVIHQERKQTSGQTASVDQPGSMAL